ncbi:MAG TPA: AarF/UbiB family protein [Sandaracinaceae bacterium LLY-WYZ-13_1]|nr:AarF/UbiB family protein [Sandaracinaceae bacterium LLY-WYZ-13_1]
MAQGETKSIFGVAIRDVARLRKVATIVARHGFGEVLLRMPFAAQLLGRGIAQEGEEARGTPAERFTRLLGALGPTYIKLGQVLSMRADLLPPDYIQALSTLQDKAPVIPYADVERVVERGLGQPLADIFEEFEAEPLATASIGQTHVAKTRDGRKVVVKVQRPGIGETMRGDLDLLYLAAKGLESSIEELKLIQPSSIVAEFEKNLLRELNFSAELANLVRAGDLLDPDRPVTVPEPLPELSCRTVLTMSFFEGRPVRALEPGSDEARHAVEEILHAMCRGVFVDGFFHGDPHAGNILVDEEGTLCFLDMGLVGTLSPEQRDDLVTLVLGTILDDASTVARVLLKMGTPTQRVDIGELKREIIRVRSEYVMVQKVTDLDTQGFIDEFANAVGKYRVKLAIEYSVLVKAAGTIEGLVRNLYPDVDVLAITKPYVERIFSERWSPQQMLQEALGGGIGMASLLRTVPTHVDQILHDFETGNIQVKPITPSLDRVPDTVYQSATRLAVALFAASMSVCAAVAIPEGYEGYMDWVRIAFFVLFTTLAIGGWTVTWWWHWLGRGRPLRLTPLLRLFRRNRG